MLGLQTWTNEILPEISRKYALRGIHFPSPNQGWAVGGTNGKWSLYGIAHDDKGAYYAVGGDHKSDKGIILKSVK